MVRGTLDLLSLVKDKRLRVKSNTRESDSRIWERTKEQTPIEIPLTTQAWLEGEVDRRKEERRREALRGLLGKRSGAVQGKPTLRKLGRRLAGWVMALRSGHGDLADYHERFGHESSVWCPCRGVPFTRAHLITCTLQDQKRETTRLAEWLNNKRGRKLKL